MRTTEYQCGRCGVREETISSVHDAEKAPLHCKEKMQWAPTHVPLGRFKYDPSKAGHDTGVYEYDWGTRATWDLTVPEKMNKLQRDGRIAPDPFDEYDADVKKGKIAPYQGASDEAL